MAQELTNIDGQFHDTVPECSGYFSFHELLGGGDDTRVVASETISLQFYHQASFCTFSCQEIVEGETTVTLC